MYPSFTNHSMESRIERPLIVKTVTLEDMCCLYHGQIDSISFELIPSIDHDDPVFSFGPFYIDDPLVLRASES